MKTADNTSAIPTTGPEISSIALREASFGDMPSSMWRSTASTTTIASSTTRPIANTRPNSESVLIENPNSGKKTNVPTRETGTASSGISVARHPCRKRKTTRITSAIAMTRVRMISLIPWTTDRVVSSAMAKSISWGKRVFKSAINFLTPFAASTAFDPGS